MAGYGTDQGLTDWLSDNGYVLPDGAPAAAVLRQRGSTYVDSVYGPRFSGYPTGGTEQERSWPRTDAYAYGSALATTLIPNAVINASYRAAYAEAVNPGSLNIIVIANERLKRAKAAAVEVEFVEKGDTVKGSIPVMPEIEGLLAPFFTSFAPAILVV